MISLKKIDAANLTPDDGDGRTLSEVFKEHFGNTGIRRILFVVPPDGDRDLFYPKTAQLGRYANYPPYGVGVIASHLKAMSIDVQILNLNDIVIAAARSKQNKDNFDYDAIVKDNIARSIDTFDPDFVGITCMFSQTHSSAVEVCRSIRNHAPDLPVAIGGVHITNNIIGRDNLDEFLSEFSKVSSLLSH